ncbi:hypothetical protein KPH14_003790 [Odynerus spinipes]|uniref:Uncharacterized protein n=1 Tax=Odynerus spinipes TaxID=1348599 RepID=A0AAD9VVH9_9HYME|nr:hypothetical protein KPH14_003790 [Odynerus spinipes]
MKYQLLLLFALLGGIQCRLIIFPEVDETNKEDNAKMTRIERSIDDDATFSSLDLPKSVDLMNLLNFDKEFIEHYNREKHNQPRFANISPSLPLLEKFLIDDEARVFRSCAEQVDEMLHEIQNALGRLRNYLDEWCRKHQAMMLKLDLPASLSSDAN